MGSKSENPDKAHTENTSPTNALTKALVLKLTNSLTYPLVGQSFITVVLGSNPNMFHPTSSEL